MFRNHQMQWIIPNTPACRKCGNKNHITNQCKDGHMSKREAARNPKLQSLAKLYERKHVPISTPVNFGGMRWADVVKKSIKKEASKTTASTNYQSKSTIEQRLDQMEQMINQILAHLQIKPEQTEQPKEKTTKEI